MSRKGTATAPHEPAEVQLKSLCEVERVAKMFRSFDDAKRELVWSIGFHGLLKTPLIDKLDDNFSMWLLRTINPKTMVLSLPNGESLEVKDVDAHFVLGIPFRGRKVSHENRHDKDVVNKVVGKLSIGGHKASLTLEYLEWVLGKDYGTHFLPEEKVAFTIAVVLYSMGCFLAAHGSRISFPVWLLGNFVGRTAIHEYNWSGYVLSVLAFGAQRLQEQLVNGDDIVRLNGCTFLLQVLYLDNMDFGHSSAVQLDIPRGCVYNTLYIKHLIALDSKQHPGSDVVEYGRHKLRHGSLVCYSRGWNSKPFEKWGECESSYLAPSEIFHNLLVYDDKLARLFADPLSKISASTSADIRKKYNSWYPEYKAMFSHFPAATFVHSNVQNLGEDCGSTNRPQGNAGPSKKARANLVAQEVAVAGHGENAGIRLTWDQSALDLLAEEATRIHDTQGASPNNEEDCCFVWEDGFLKKLVKEHSKFGQSPFELGRFMYTITWRKKTALYDWLEPGAEDWGHLTRSWIHIDYPAPVALLGYDLKMQLGPHGYMTTAMIDAITRASMEFDETAYGEKGTRWRHFLPARFAEVVLGGADFLSSEEIKAHFTGQHIKYPVENCRLVIAPVQYQGRWNCYVWDFQRKSVTVLDPTRMNTSVAAIELHHADLVSTLTTALFGCIGRFFSGWDFDSGKWRQLYPIHHGPRSKICTSGLYSVLYSRYFDGKELVCVPSKGGLVEPRSAILYELLTLRGNKAVLPPRIKDIVTRPWVLKRH